MAKKLQVFVDAIDGIDRANRNALKCLREIDDPPGGCFDLPLVTHHRVFRHTVQSVVGAVDRATPTASIVYATVPSTPGGYIPLATPATFHLPVREGFEASFRATHSQRVA